ncbi:MAG TPA: hypothetical protein VMX14_02415 [Anaerolineae bacterium]|nr:hypothetical protein [Anaerolineae bacterium]
MAKSINVTWSEGVADQESQTMTETLRQVLGRLYLRLPSALAAPPIEVRVFGNWVIPALLPDRPYWGTQWYINTSYDDELKRVIAPSFLELVRKEPWQRLEPHFDLALLDYDLTDFPSPVARLLPGHYALGSSFPGTTAVMSVYRIRELTDRFARELALTRLVRHHLGHVLGVPQFTRKERVERLGLELHCTNPCAMRHAPTVERLARLALEESEMGWPFCELCTRELYSIVVRHTYTWS